MFCRTPKEFCEKYGFDPDLLPEASQDDWDKLLELSAIIYRKLCEDEKLNDLEEFWKMAEDCPELEATFRRVHEDPTFGLEPAL